MPRSGTSRRRSARSASAPSTAATTIEARNFQRGEVLPVDLAMNARSYGVDVIEIAKGSAAIDDLRAAVAAAKARSGRRSSMSRANPTVYGPDGEGWWDVPVGRGLAHRDRSTGARGVRGSARRTAPRCWGESGRAACAPGTSHPVPRTLEGMTETPRTRETRPQAAPASSRSGGGPRDQEATGAPGDREGGPSRRMPRGVRSCSSRAPSAASRRCTWPTSHRPNAIEKVKELGLPGFRARSSCRALLPPTTRPTPSR